MSVREERVLKSQQLAVYGGIERDIETALDDFVHTGLIDTLEELDSSLPECIYADDDLGAMVKKALKLLRRAQDVAEKINIHCEEAKEELADELDFTE